jgi:hypothetical protein
VIHVFQPELKLPDALEELQSLYWSLLIGRRELLLLDNAANGAQVKPLVPPPAGWAVLVTSRTRFQLHGGCLHDVDLLSPDGRFALRRTLSDGGRHDLTGADLAPSPNVRPVAAQQPGCRHLTSMDRPADVSEDLERAG